MKIDKDDFDKIIQEEFAGASTETRVATLRILEKVYELIKGKKAENEVPKFPPCVNFNRKTKCVDMAQHRVACILLDFARDFDVPLDDVCEAYKGLGVGDIRASLIKHFGK